MLLPMGIIDPFDSDHTQYGRGFLVKPYESLQTHRHILIIEWMKTMIIENFEIRPILVQKLGDRFQRLDGFCRYWAYKELGYTEIPVVLGDKHGGQDGMNPFIKYEGEAL